MKCHVTVGNWGKCVIGPLFQYRDPETQGEGRLVCIIAQGTLERGKTENPILIAQNQSAEGRETVSTH